MKNLQYMQNLRKHENVQNLRKIIPNEACVVFNEVTSLRPCQPARDR